MKLKIMTLSFDPTLQAFDDRPWEEFQKSVTATSVDHHYFEASGRPCLMLAIRYLPLEPSSVKTKPQTAEHWRTLLDESDMGMFEILRNWRSQCARSEGVPPYVLLTNVQLASITKARPNVPAELLELIGEAKTKKFGEQIVKFFQIHPSLS